MTQAMWHAVLEIGIGSLALEGDVALGENPSQRSRCWGQWRHLAWSEMSFVESSDEGVVVGSSPYPG